MRDSARWTVETRRKDGRRESIVANQLQKMQERGSDLTIFSPRASFMAHHIGDFATGNLGANAIVGGSVPIATGAATKAGYVFFLSASTSASVETTRFGLSSS